MAKKPTGKNTSGRGQRDLKVKVKTATGERTVTVERFEPLLAAYCLP